MKAAQIAGILSIATIAHGEVLKFKDGGQVSGVIVSLDGQGIRFRHCGQVETYHRSDVAAIAMHSLPEHCSKASSSERILTLPAGTKIRARLLDFIDASHEPLGQSFRAQAVKPIVVEGSIAVPANSRLLVKLRPLNSDQIQDRRIGSEDHGLRTGPGLAGKGTQQVLDLAGVQLSAKEWASFGIMGSELKVATVSDVTDARTPQAGMERLAFSGERVYLPSQTLLTFTLSKQTRLMLAPP